MDSTQTIEANRLTPPVGSLEHARHALLRRGDTLVDLVATSAILLVNGFGSPVLLACAVAIHGFLLATRQPRLPLRVDQVLSGSRILFTGAIAGSIAFLAGATSTRAAVVTVSTMAASMIGRTAQVELVREARCRRLIRERLAVIGGRDQAASLRAAFDARPALGVDAIGHIDPDDFDRAVSRGQVQDLLPKEADGFLVSRQIELTPTVLSALRWISARGHRVLVEAPHDRVGRDGLVGSGVRVGHSWVRCLPAPPRNYRMWMIKRTMDVVTASALFVLTAPIIAAGAMAIRLSSTGPAIFRQTRIGYGGQPFTMLKLRTFPVDHIDATHSLDHEQCPLLVGRFLRRTSIDELPQLWNVLRGQMSIIGPRPERRFFAETLAEQVPGYQDRHRVPGGITGLAQVSGFWGNTSIDQRVHHDNLYIDEWSIWLDLKILLRTIPATVRKGAG